MCKQKCHIRCISSIVSVSQALTRRPRCSCWHDRAAGPAAVSAHRPAPAWPRGRSFLAVTWLLHLYLYPLLPWLRLRVAHRSSAESQSTSAARDAAAPRASATSARCVARVVQAEAELYWQRGRMKKRGGKWRRAEKSGDEWAGEGQRSEKYSIVILNHNHQTIRNGANLSISLKLFVVATTTTPDVPDDSSWPLPPYDEVA